MDTLNEFISITKIIENIYNFRLKEFIDNNQNLCELSINFFNEDELPDYTKEHVQESYLLKYSLAYSFEFYEMYNQVIDSLKDKQYINVLSLGCGSCIDYWSLCYTLYKKNLNIKINYIGVDKIKWESNGIEELFDKTNCATNYKFNKREEDNSYFLKSEIKDLENAINNNSKCNEINSVLSNLDIIIFPRSMNEICSNEENNEVIKNISKKITNNQFYLLSSIIYIKADKFLFNKVIGIISSSLNFKNILNGNILPSNKECGISAIDSNFQYPEYVKNAYKTICQYRDKDDNICHIYNKECFINQGPILYADKIKYMYGTIGKEL